MRTIAEGTVAEVFKAFDPSQWTPDPFDRDPYEFLAFSAIQREAFKVVELEPQRRTLKFQMAYQAEDRGKKRLNVPLPYLQFFFFRGYLGVAASGEPYKPGDDFYASPFPNTYATGKVCLGEAANRVVMTLEKALTLFFWSGFDNPCEWDLSIDFAASMGQPCNTYPEADAFLNLWSGLSVDDMLKCPWDNVLGERYPTYKINPARDKNTLGNLGAFLAHVCHRGEI